MVLEVVNLPWTEQTSSNHDFHHLHIIKYNFMLSRFNSNILLLKFILSID